MREAIIDWIKGFYTFKGNFDKSAFDSHIVWWTIGLCLALILASVIVWFVSRFLLVQIVHITAGKSRASWDDHMVKNKVFKGVALLVPLMFMEYFLSIAFYNYPNFLQMTDKFVWVLIIVAVIIIVNRFFNGVRDIMLDMEGMSDKPVQSYTQILKIVTTGVLLILILSVVTNKSPLFFLTSLGAISAILLLVFKDTILGFVGSIQLATHDMIRLGDWVTMEKFGADGIVEEINLATVKVRNFDKTITTIPTYTLISDSFKNWRGMEESEGRRIKRSIRIHIDSINFASPELLDKLRSNTFLQEFIDARQAEIVAYNEKHGFVGENIIHARKQTNIGLFRRYVEYYLNLQEGINKDMTLVVRQLEPTELGLPLEIYCFTTSKEFELYESTLADIFDHLLAVIHQFELRTFEVPTGYDMLRVKD